MKPSRRLLTMSDLAELFGFSTDWVYRNRQKLEAQGFPAPILGDSQEKGTHFRWDERAVDRWLDSRMPEHLKKDRSVDETKTKIEVRFDLAERARSLQL